MVRSGIVCDGRGGGRNLQDRNVKPGMMGTVLTKLLDF